MKLNILYLLFLPIFLLAQASEYSIVFVHIGNKLPDYMDIAIDQARLFNEECDIFLVANQKALKNYDNPDAHLVTCESLKTTDHHHYFQNNTTLNTSFRDGFWRYATERFFYIDELAKKFHLKHIFHIESDNMVYVDFNELLPIFKEHYPGMGAVFPTEERCIPSIVYFSNIKATHDLTTYLAHIAKRRIHDMRSLAIYRDRATKEKIDHLPVIFKEYTIDNMLGIKHKKRVKNVSKFYNHIEEFNSIFDGQAIGYYLGGRDPRNQGLSFPGQINLASLFDPRLLTFTWIEDEKGRAVPFMVYKDLKYRINNIHVHCKDLKKFFSLEHKLGDVVIPSTPEKNLYVY